MPIHTLPRRLIHLILASTIIGVAILAANGSTQDTEKSGIGDTIPAPAAICVREIERREVRGTSMSGLLEPGREIEILVAGPQGRRDAIGSPAHLERRRGGR